jgi:hypothetical protein
VANIVSGGCTHWGSPKRLPPGWNQAMPELDLPPLGEIDLVPALVERGLSRRRALRLQTQLGWQFALGRCGADWQCKARPVHAAVLLDDRGTLLRPLRRRRIQVAVACEEHAAVLGPEWSVSPRVVTPTGPSGSPPPVPDSLFASDPGDPGDPPWNADARKSPPRSS